VSTLEIDAQSRSFLVSQLIATPYLQKLVQMRLPQSRLSPALTNGRGAPYELEWSDGMRLADIFITIMSKAWKVKDARQRTSLSPKYSPILRARSLLSRLYREILTTLGKKYDQYNDVSQSSSTLALRTHLVFTVQTTGCARVSPSLTRCNANGGV
jgi:hypothetical protein